jgi:hypothetical protein
MMGMDYSGFYMIAEPKDPYIINTIHYLPENSKLIGIGEMTGLTKFANMPYFLKISKGRKYTIELIFNRYYENNGNTFNRFSDSYQYKLISKISVLPQIKFYTLLKSLNIFDYKKSFIYKKDYNCLISSKKTIVANETFKESNISLNKNDFIIINKMFRTKITLHSNIKKMESSLSF